MQRPTLRHVTIRVLYIYHPYHPSYVFHAHLTLVHLCKDSCSVRARRASHACQRPCIPLEPIHPTSLPHSLTCKRLPLFPSLALTAKPLNSGKCLSSPSPLPSLLVSLSSPAPHAHPCSKRLGSLCRKRTHIQLLPPLPPTVASSSLLPCVHVCACGAPACSSCLVPAAP